MISTRLLTIPAGTGGGVDDTRFIVSNWQGECLSGVDGGEMYADCRFGSWICGSEMGFSGEACLWLRKGLDKVELLVTIAGKGFIVEVLCLGMVGKTRAG